MLVSAGHPLKEVLGYSLKQISGFVQLVMGRRKLELASMVSGVRAAHHSDKEGFTNYMRSLE